MWKTIQKILLNNWFIAMVLGIMVFLMIPFHPDPYKADVIFVSSLDEHDVQFFDMDNDGLDELIKSIYKADEHRFSHVVVRPNGNTVDQFNINNVEKLPRTKCLVGDYNHDGFAELFSLYQKNEKVFLVVHSPFCDTCAVHEREIEICKVPFVDTTEGKVQTTDMQLVDLFGDKNLELVFNLFGTFRQIDPRKIFAVEIDKQQVISTPQYGNCFDNIVFFDYDHDGSLELSGRMGSGANIHEEQKWEYTDSAAWLMVYDNELEMINEPPPCFPGPYSVIDVIPLPRNHKTELAGLMCHNGNKGYGSYLFETKGLEDIIIRDSIGLRVPRVGDCMEVIHAKGKSKIVLSSSTGDLLFYDMGLNFLSQENLDRQIGPLVILDLNHDGKDEIVIHDVITKERLILNSSGRLMTKILFEFEGESGGGIGVTNGRLGFTGYYSSYPYMSYFTLTRNYMFYLKWLVLLGLFGFFYGLAITFKWIQRKQTGEREAVKQELIALQLQSIKNQLDPHFTFNALNVLNFLSSNNDNEGVETFTHHFSKLLRRQIEISDRPSVKLYDELQFVRHYIELQKLRFDIPIVYDEDIAKDVDMNLRIPKMMVHTHVENAIKHGLIPSGRGGEVKVTIKKNKKSTIIFITDNGVGYSRESMSVASEHDKSGKGLAILDQLYKLYYQLFKVEIRQEIKTLSDPTGTEVIIHVAS